MCGGSPFNFTTKQHNVDRGGGDATGNEDYATPSY